MCVLNNTSQGNGALIIVPNGAIAIEISDEISEIKGFNNYPACEHLKTIVISKNVKKILPNVFLNCNALEKVYYKGTPKDWSSICIASDNANLTNAARYYYSEERPTQSGSYWHYVDGVVVEW